MNRANYSASSQESSKNEPDLSYLPHLRPVITTMHLMLACVHTVLLPLASSSITIRRQMEKATSTAVNRMEEKVNSVMQHTVEVVSAWISKLLQSQKKSDFRPKDGVDGAGPGGGWLEMLQTPVCSSSFSIRSRVSTENNGAIMIDVQCDLHLPCQGALITQRIHRRHESISVRLGDRIRCSISPARALQEIPRECSWRVDGHQGHDALCNDPSRDAVDAERPRVVGCFGRGGESVCRRSGCAEGSSQKQRRRRRGSGSRSWCRGVKFSG